MSNDTSNPAFPHSRLGSDHDGMDLRDYFAAKAMQEPVAWMVYTLDGTAAFVTLNPADFTGEHRALPLYTNPQPQEFVCSTGFCRFTLTQTNVGIGERGMQAYEEAKKRGWVGISDEMEMPKQEPK
jgi:hypothetical protein